MPEFDVPAPRRKPSRVTGLDLARALTEMSQDRLSGALMVSGEPGGSFHLRCGALVEVASPGAPGVEILLLRSGRVSEADWVSVTRSCAADGRVGAVLIAQDLVGSAELQLMCVMAALDGALAVGMGRIDDFTFEQDARTCRLAAPDGIEPEWLVEEAGRRIRVLGALAQYLSPFRSRLARTHVSSAWLANTATGERREILLRANGRMQRSGHRLPARPEPVRRHRRGLAPDERRPAGDGGTGRCPKP